MRASKLCGKRKECSTKCVEGTACGISFYLCLRSRVVYFIDSARTIFTDTFEEIRNDDNTNCGSFKMLSQELLLDTECSASIRPITPVDVTVKL